MPAEPALRIGFDATAAVSQGAGIGRYTRELLRALVGRPPRAPAARLEPVGARQRQ